MQLSQQQQALIDWGRDSNGSANVIARAGTGKTTTLVEFTKTLVGRVFLGAFNKSIAMELVARVAENPNAVASTMHSAGLKLWYKMIAKSDVQERKMRDVLKAMRMYQTDKDVRDVVLDLLSFAKQSGFGVRWTGCPKFTDREAWDKLAEHHGLWEEIPGLVGGYNEDDWFAKDAESQIGKASLETKRFYRFDIITNCIAAYKRSLEICRDRLASVIDYDDMILAPLYFGLQNGGEWMRQYDWVLVDEAQDTSYTRLILAQMLLKPGGRLVAVGDPAQAIYGFAGAAPGAMDTIKAEMDSIELPLNVTYRCPKTVVTLANQWVPDFVAHEANQEGEVKEIGHRELWDLAATMDPQHDVILCRNTRPLVGIAKRLRKHMGIPCRVEGQNAKGLITLAEKWGTDITLREMELKLKEWAAVEARKFLDAGKEAKADYVRERCEILLDLMDEMDMDSAVSKLVSKIGMLFGLNERKNNPAPNVLRLCTVHRAKGREWTRVTLVGRNRYMPSKYATQAHELEQEKNLMYVAVTRAKRELVEVMVPVPKDGKKEQTDWWEL
jgi:DNA helicase II / ATP-dependent DNA helicase PcrA